MATGSRGLLAPWIGGAANPPWSVGIRSMLAPWFGGVAKPADGQCGNRSMLAPWMGGACVYPSGNAGPIGLLAFWMGGAGSAFVTPVPPDSGSAPMQPRRFHIRPEPREDEEILAIILGFLHTMNNE